jgi:hypothetical protein
VKANSNGMKWMKVIEAWSYPIILALYSLRHIRYGVDWWDTGYSYGNFVYMEEMDPMWKFSTYLSTALGHLFTKLPFGDTMVGMNFYTSLLVSIMSVGGYFFFVHKIHIPKAIAFLGELLAINLSWCPTAVLYNYLTYLLFGGGAILLYMALTAQENTTKERIYFVMAGILLGINIFVRFPNVTHMGLIVLVWGYGWIRKKKRKEVVQQTLWCMLGYAIGIAVCLIGISIRYGITDYVDAILRLFTMPSDASDYSPVQMVLSQLRNYRLNLYWLVLPFVGICVGCLFFSMIPKQVRKFFYVPYILCAFVLFYYLRQQNMFNFTYTTLMSVQQWAFSLLTLLIGMGAVILFRAKSAKTDKLMVSLTILIVLITPLGTNNHLIASINNLYLVAPIFLWFLYRFCKNGPSVAGRRLNLFPLKAMLVCITVMLFIQSILFGLTFVFTEADGGENLHTRVEENDILRGMYTTSQRTQVIESLSEYVEREGLKGHPLIVYGMIPAMPYYLEMPFAISAWPDLRSYQYDIMAMQLDETAQEAQNSGQLPLVLLEIRYGAYALGGEDAVLAIGQDVGTIAEDQKFALLRDWLVRYQYQEIFSNEKFVLFRAEIIEK